MPAARFWNRWLRLPSRLALLLGMGAASAAGAQAAVPGIGERAGHGDAMIRSENGRIYLCEGGSEGPEWPRWTSAAENRSRGGACFWFELPTTPATGRTGGDFVLLEGTSEGRAS